MLIGGIQKFSLIDYPKKLSAIIFTQGCFFRCHYCHNAELVLPEQFQKPLLEEEILDFLKTRIGKLEAVVITGGEPTMQPDLFLFIKKIKELGFLIKLDTSGIYPHKIEFLLKSNLLDYIAMDIKAPLDKYHLITGRKLNPEKIKKSIDLLINCSISYEFRTTLVKDLHKNEDVLEIAKTVKGAELLVLQKFVATSTLNPSLKSYVSFSEEFLNDSVKEAKQYVKNCIIR